MKHELFRYNQYIPEEEKIKLRLDREREIFRHSHEFIELVYVIDGEADHIVEDRTYRIRKGDFFLLDSGVTHAFNSEGEGVYICNCIFHPQFLNEVLADSSQFIELSYHLFFNSSFSSEKKFGYVQFPRESSGIPKDIILDMEKEYQEKKPEYLRVLKSHLITLLVKLFRLCNDNLQKKKEKSDVVQSIIEYAENCNPKDLSVSVLSHALFFSPSYLSRVFRERTNETLLCFIQKKKMEQVRSLLVNSEDSIDSIMYEVGYHDKKTFYKLFASFYSLTPGEYRKIYKKA